MARRISQWVPTQLNIMLLAIRVGKAQLLPVARSQVCRWLFFPAKLGTPCQRMNLEVRARVYSRRETRPPYKSLRWFLEHSSTPRSAEDSHCDLDHSNVYSLRYDYFVKDMLTLREFSRIPQKERQG